MLAILSQVSAFTSSHSVKIAESCDNMARKGTLTRAFDACPGLTVAMVIATIVLVAIVALLVTVVIQDRRIARNNASVVPYCFASPNTTIVDIQTRNLKGNR